MALKPPARSPISSFRRTVDPGVEPAVGHGPRGAGQPAQGHDEVLRQEEGGRED